MPPEICPNCGAEVPPRAKACPECGADEETGWSEQAQSQRLGLPDEEFNYQEFIENEFAAEKKTVRPAGISWLWWIVAVVLVLAFLSWATRFW
jgi:uncharacterized membrane protein YvbJ